MPSVLDNSTEPGRTETYRKFVKMLSKNRFRMQNIVWLLFLDVVNFVDSGNTVAMTYNNRVTVLFWKIGYKLMHGKFLRYCGGFKNQGQVISGETEKGYYLPENASINFVVPDLKALQKDETYMGRAKRIYYLSPMQAAKVQASLRIRAVSPEPSLLANT